MENLNLLSEELLEQIFIRLNNINWEEDQLDEIMGDISEIEEELELEYNYNYHIRYKSQVQKIKEQLELKQNQLIKNLILSNQIKIQF